MCEYKEGGSPIECPRSTVTLVHLFRLPLAYSGMVPDRDPSSDLIELCSQHYNAAKRRESEPHYTKRNGKTVVKYVDEYI